MFSHKISILFIFLIGFSFTKPISADTYDDLEKRVPPKHDDFFFVSIPKCGTHLMSKTISLLLMKHVDEGYDWVEEHSFGSDYKIHFRKALQNAKKGSYIHKTHVPWFPKIEDFFGTTKHKRLFQIRDPRDAVISLVFYLEMLKHHGDRRDFFHVNSQIYNNLTLDEKITAVMTGSCCLNYLQIWMKKEIPWALSKSNLVVRFEDLIGERGGGSIDKQLNALFSIAQYLSVDLSMDDALEISQAIYKPSKDRSMGGKVYRGGQVGNWTEFFTEEHKKIFKNVLGKELIQLGYEADNNW